MNVLIGGVPGEHFWFSTVQAAEHVGVHVDTVRKAADSGALHGYQRVARGHWRFHRDCLDAWVTGRRCQHQCEASTT